MWLAPRCLLSQWNIKSSWSQQNEGLICEFARGLKDFILSDADLLLLYQVRVSASNSNSLKLSLGPFTWLYKNILILRCYIAPSDTVPMYRPHGSLYILRQVISPSCKVSSNHTLLFTSLMSFSICHFALAPSSGWFDLIENLKKH